MNVLFITAWWPSRLYPAHGNFVAKHARLVARRHALKVVAVQPDPALAAGRCEVEVKKQDGYTAHLVYFGPPRSSLLKLPARLRAYRAGLRSAYPVDEQPDLIHAHVLLDGGVVASLWAKYWNVPFVITEHSTFYDRYDRLSPVRSWLAKRACRQAAFVMPVSEQLGQRMRDVFGLDGEYRALSNVVDISLFRPSEELPPMQPFRLLHVSNFLERHKNISGLLRSYAQLSADYPDRFHLYLAGDGDHAEVGKKMDALGLTDRSVTLSGPHTEEEVADLMRQVHAFVLFSNTETQGVVLLEAQCVGLPCVATGVGGVPGVIEDGKTGILVSAGDNNALRTAIFNLYQAYSQFDPRVIREHAISICGEKQVMAKLDGIYYSATHEIAC